MLKSYQERYIFGTLSLSLSLSRQFYETFPRFGSKQKKQAPGGKKNVSFLFVRTSTLFLAKTGTINVQDKLFIGDSYNKISMSPQDLLRKQVDGDGHTHATDATAAVHASRTYV